MGVRASVNQGVQIGVEPTPGTSVSAGKILDAWTVKPGAKADVKQSTPSGRKYVTAQEENREWVEWAADSTLMCFNALVYELSSVVGAMTTGASNSSATAKDWTVTPVVSGSATPKTFTIEQGSTERAHKFSYGLLNKWGYKFSKAEASSSSSGIARKLADGISMTSSPTRISCIPCLGSYFNVYLDTTSAGLGGTQLTEILNFEYNFEGVFGPVWYVNRTDTSFSTHVDLMPKCTAKLLLEANSTGMALLTNLRASDTLFLRVEAIGAQIASDGGGGTDPVYNQFIHDMAVTVSAPNDFEDSEGVFASPWELTIVEDSTWGQAQTFTVTNLLTAL